MRLVIDTNILVSVLLAATSLPAQLIEVLRPVESQPTVGRVRNVVRQADGGIYMVVNYGGLFGFFTRPIAVPVTAMALLGEYVEVIDFTPHQLDNFQRFDAAGTTPLPPDSLIDVGLIGPAH